MGQSEGEKQTLYTWGVFSLMTRAAVPKLPPRCCHCFGGSRVGFGVCMPLGRWGVLAKTPLASPSLARQDDAAKWVGERGASSRLGSLSNLIRHQGGQQFVSSEA